MRGWTTRSRTSGRLGRQRCLCVARLGDDDVVRRCVVRVGVDERDLDLTVWCRDEQELLPFRDVARNDRPRERRQQVPLDRALERARAELGAEALLDQERDCRLVELDSPRPATPAAALGHVGQLLVEECMHLRALERAEDDDPVEPIEELGSEMAREGTLDLLGPEHGVGALEAEAGASSRDRRADVRGQDDHAAAEVGGSPVLVGEPAVVEDLQEEVPDRLRSLLELVEQDDGERVLADGRDQRRTSVVDVRIGQEPLVAVGRLILAHVEADHPIRRAEEELCQRLRDLRLAGSGRADEEEDGQRAARIGEAGLDESDPVDETVDRLWLTEHPLLEEGAHVVEMQRSGRVENGQGQPRQRREGRQHVAAGEAAAPVLDGIVDRGLEQLEGVAGRCDPRDELLRELEALGQHLVGDRRSPSPGCRARGERPPSSPRRRADGREPPA